MLRTVTERHRKFLVWTTHESAGVQDCACLALGRQSHNFRFNWDLSRLPRVDSFLGHGYSYLLGLAVSYVL